MSSVFQRLLKHRRAVTILLAATFLFVSLFLVDARVFVCPPGLGGDAVFIGEAKAYYFEGSSARDKDARFRDAVYKDLWLSLPNVSSVITADEVPGADHDFDTGDAIRYVTVDDQQIDRMLYSLTGVQDPLYEDALNQVSAAAWERAKSDLVVCVIVWVCFGAVFAAWCVCLKRLS